MDASAGGGQRATIRIRLLSMLYEGVLLAALLLAATAVFTAFAGDSRAQPMRTLLQAHLLLVAGIYFVWSWSGGRRTLAMRTWRLRLVDTAGHNPTSGAAALRFLVAALALPLGAAGVLWALWDPERQFLHDRVAGTRLVREPDPNALVPSSKEPRRGRIP